MELLEVLKSALVDADNNRSRSTQVEIGASSIGGCRRQAWHILQQTPKTNNGGERLSAILGTSIHHAIQEALLSYDVFGDDFLIETPVATDGLKGNIDFYSRKDKLVADWKTVTLKKIETGRWLDAQKKIQVNLYAYMLIEAGYEVERVALVGIPRDGKMSQIVKWEAPYDPKIAQKGLDWLADVRSRTTAPDPEKPAAIFCREYCSWYDPSGKVGCTGK